MIITNEWLEKNSCNLCWTYAQFSVLGLPIPPKRGWKALVIGREISTETAKRFAEARFIKAKKRNSPLPGQARLFP